MRSVSVHRLDVTMATNFFTFLAHNTVPEALGKSKHPRWRIQDGRHLTIMTLLPRDIASLLLIADLKGDIFKRTIYPSNLTDIAFLLATLWRTPPAPEDKKSPV